MVQRLRGTKDLLMLWLSRLLRIKRRKDELILRRKRKKDKQAIKNKQHKYLLERKILTL